MLSRVADAIYWMSRYVERAENMARFIEVNWHMTLDQPSSGFQQWAPLINVSGDYDIFVKRYGHAVKENVISFLTLDTDYPHSIISCLRGARESARTVREIISSEMWEQINTFYHIIEDAARNHSIIYDNPNNFCQEVKYRGMMIGGVANDTMSHEESWHFFRMGRSLERADKTSRILDVKYFILLPNPNYVGMTFDDIQWAALLRTTGALDSYRQRYGRILPAQVAEYLMLDREFPRAVLHCLLSAQRSLHCISGTPVGAFRNQAEQLMGHLCAELAYMRIEKIFEKGLHEFTDDLQNEMNKVDNTIAEIFFGYPPPEEKDGKCEKDEQTSDIQHQTSNIQHQTSNIQHQH